MFEILYYWTLPTCLPPPPPHSAPTHPLSTKILLEWLKISIQYWKMFFTFNSFFFRCNNTRNSILYGRVHHVEKPDFLTWDHSFRAMAIASLKIFASGKPVTGCGLVLLYLMQISHFSSKSFIWDFNSSSFI